MYFDFFLIKFANKKFDTIEFYKIIVQPLKQILFVILILSQFVRLC